MNRIIVYSILLILFSALTFPHDALVRNLIGRYGGPLASSLNYADVRPQLWPPGYRLSQVAVKTSDFDLALRRVSMGPGFLKGPWFNVEGCGGSLRGQVRPERPNREPTDGTDLRVRVDRIDPSKCLNLGGLELSGKFSGNLVLQGIPTNGESKSLDALGRSGAINLSAATGTFGGQLPGNSADGTSDGSSLSGRPIGQWKFSDAEIHGTLNQGTISLDKSQLTAEGVEFLVEQSKLSAAAGNRISVRADFGARTVDDSLRAKAILNLLPKATEKNSWRHYRVLGTLDAPRLIGLK